MATGMNLTGGGPGIADWTSGYRVFTAPAARWLLSCDYQATMHAWQIEVLLQAHRGGLSIAEVPITYQAGQSALNRAAVREVGRVWLSAFEQDSPKREVQR
jgi:hypothetical protein